MAQPAGNSSRVKLIVVLLALGLGLYIVGPPLYWQFYEGMVDTRHDQACPVCLCDCASTNLVNTAVSSLGNFSLSDCGKDDPEMKEDIQKSRTETLAEELKLQEVVSEEAQQRADTALLDAKKISSQYQKEAEKCNIGIETSEEAREKAEAALQAQKKITAMWMKRARSLGWVDKQNDDTPKESSKDE